MNESECCECRCTCYIEKGDNKLSKFDISVVHYKQKGVDRFKDRMHTLISHSNSNRNIIEHILFPQQQSGTKIGKKVKETETDDEGKRRGRPFGKVAMRQLRTTRWLIVVHRMQHKLQTIIYPLVSDDTSEILVIFYVSRDHYPHNHHKMIFRFPFYKA